MDVYRVEMECGTGPYRDPREDNWRYAAYHTSSHLPCPYEEGIGIKSSERCGFASRKQFIKWFNARDRREMRKRGYRLVRFEVPAEAVRKGKAQVVFERSLATPVEVLVVAAKKRAKPA
jgi:hypothetical protein